MTSTIYSGPKAKLCPHGVLGKSKCKRCKADWALAKSRKNREYNPLPPRKTIEERFWDKVSKSDGCWLWNGSVDTEGYGQLYRGGKHQNVAAHRFSWQIHFGDIPIGMKVLHRCDTPPCVRPDHLFLGTQADNIADMDAKGRRSHGEASPSAKLSENDVRQIRHSTKRNVELSLEFNVDASVISEIRSGKKWRHVV